MDECLYDKDFRKKMLEDPKAIVKGLAKDVEIKVVKNTKDKIYIVFPASLDETLKSITAGGQRQQGQHGNESGSNWWDSSSVNFNPQFTSNNSALG